MKLSSFVLLVTFISSTISKQFFLNNDILKSKNIIFFVDKNKFIINNCDDFSISLKIIVKNDERVKRTIRVQTNVFISTYFCSVISMKFRDFKLLNKNMMFNFDQINRLNKKENVFVHIMNVNFFVIQMKNITNQFVIIIKNERLNILTKYEKKKLLSD